MSAPAEDLPEWPEGVLEAELAGFDAAGREPDDGCGGWIDDALSAEIDAELDAGQRDRDRHCAHPGCRRRARRCQVHHITHWADGGTTDLANTVLLCSYHYHLIHHSTWQIHMNDGLPWFTPPAHIDPRRRPRHNRPWQLAEHDQAA